MSIIPGNNEGPTQKKQKTDELSNTILIKFTNSKDSTTFYCTVKPTTTFKKIIQTYCTKYSLPEGSVRFIYNDRKLLENLTPADMNFPDGGEVDVMSIPHGGEIQTPRSFYACSRPFFVKL